MTNTVVVEPGKLDRSPTGTGVSARMALLRARGAMAVGDRLRMRSVIGSEFVGRIEADVRIGDGPGARDAIVPDGVRASVAIRAVHLPRRSHRSVATRLPHQRHVAGVTLARVDRRGAGAATVDGVSARADRQLERRSHVSYIDKSREYYEAQGFEQAYRWAAFDDVPFARPVRSR